MRYKCKKAGQQTKSVSGQPLACQGCDGIITKEENRVIAPTIRGGFWSYPRVASAGFNCPCTIERLETSELVEEIS